MPESPRVKSGGQDPAEKVGQWMGVLSKRQSALLD